MVNPTPLRPGSLRKLNEARERHAAANNIDGYSRAYHDFHTKGQASMQAKSPGAAHA